MGKVYVVINSFHEDFHIYAATANKELAEAVYNKYSKVFSEYMYLSDLEILEYTDEQAIALLNL
jgi:hypothetical protein